MVLKSKVYEVISSKRGYPTGGKSPRALSRIRISRSQQIVWMGEESIKDAFFSIFLVESEKPLCEASFMDVLFFYAHKLF